MKCRVAAAMVLGCLLLWGCAWITGPQVSGRWEGTAVLEMTPDPESCEIVLNLTEADGIITGTLRCPEFIGLPPADLTGSLAGSHVELTGSLMGSPLALEGEVHRGTIAGTSTHRGHSGPWEVTRAD
jgi:hypothetical protein